MLTSLFGDLQTIRDKTRDVPGSPEERDRGFAATAILDSVAPEVNQRGQIVDNHLRDLVVEGSPAQAIREHYAATRANLDLASRHITLYDPADIWATSVIKALSDASGRPIERLHLREQGTLRTLALIERTTLERRYEDPLRIYHADVRAPGADTAAIPIAMMERSHMTTVIVGVMPAPVIDEMLQSLVAAVRAPNWRCPSLLFMLPPNDVWIANKIGMINWPQRLRVQVLNESLSSASAVWNSLLGMWNRVKSEPVWGPPQVSSEAELNGFQIKVADLSAAAAAALSAPLHSGLDPTLAEQALSGMASLDGVLGCAVVDGATGFVLAQQAREEVLPALVRAAAASTQVLRAHLKSSQDMGLSGDVDEVMTSAGGRHHVIRVVSRHRELFVFALLDKQRTNLALARYKLMEAEQSLA